MFWRVKFKHHHKTTQLVMSRSCLHWQGIGPVTIVGLPSYGWAVAPAPLQLCTCKLAGPSGTVSAGSLEMDQGKSHSTQLSRSTAQHRVLGLDFDKSRHLRLLLGSTFCRFFNLLLQSWLLNTLSFKNQTPKHAQRYYIIVDVYLLVRVAPTTFASFEYLVRNGYDAGQTGKLTDWQARGQL